MTIVGVLQFLRQRAQAAQAAMQNCHREQRLARKTGGHLLGPIPFWIEVVPFDTVFVTTILCLCTEIKHL